MKRPFTLTFIIGAILFFCSIEYPPSLAEDATSIPLTARDEYDLKRIKEYLERIKTLKGNFLQIDTKGIAKSGKVFIERPGRLRFEYDPPEPILLIADGLYLIYIDKDLEQVTHVF